MNWFRLYHGTSTDPKLHKASRRAGVPRGMMLGAWVAVLEFASQQTERGTLADLDAETLAYLTDTKPSTAARILAAMEEIGLTKEGAVVAWDERQRASDDVAKRVAKHRAKPNDTRSNPIDTQSDPNGSRDIEANSLPALEIAAAGNVTETRRTEQSREDREDTPLTAPPSGGGPVASPKRKRARNAPAEETPEFKAFWDLYDARRQKGRGLAREAYAKARERASHEAIMSGLMDAVAEWRAKITDEKYIPLPTTWLNQDRWADGYSKRPPVKPPQIWQTL